MVGHRMNKQTRLHASCAPGWLGGPQRLQRRHGGLGRSATGHDPPLRTQARGTHLRSSRVHSFSEVKSIILDGRRKKTEV
jgi:hypothetical protein